MVVGTDAQPKPQSSNQTHTSVAATFTIHASGNLRPDARCSEAVMQPSSDAQLNTGNPGNIPMPSLWFRPGGCVPGCVEPGPAEVSDRLRIAYGSPKYDCLVTTQIFCRGVRPSFSNYLFRPKALIHAGVGHPHLHVIAPRR